MLTSKNLDDKTYQELIEEAISRISIYSKEWTNYSASDPGITILENLTAFQALLRQQLNTVTDTQKEKLLKLAGIEPRQEQVSRVLLQAPKHCLVSELLEREKFISGEVCFETERAQKIPGRIVAVYTECFQDDKKSQMEQQQSQGVSGLFSHCQREDVTCRLLGEEPGNTAVFGENPQVGDSIYFVVDSLPEVRGQEIYLYVEIAECFPRNSWREPVNPWFAKLQWSVYAKRETGDGFAKVAKVEDDTGAFLRSGEIKLTLGACKPVYCRVFSQHGYVLRCQLTEAQYDLAPRLQRIWGLLFPVYQRETLGFVTHYHSGEAIMIGDLIYKESYLSVYGKAQGQESYYLYQENQEQERYRCQWELQKDGTRRLRLWQQPEEICVVSCCEKFFNCRKLEIVYGYQGQIIQLHGLTGIEGQSLVVMTEQEDMHGNLCYDFFPPHMQGINDLYYTYDSSKRQIEIQDCGAYEGAQLYLCAAAVFLGEEGNARSGNHFCISRFPEAGKFMNPAEGQGGRFREDISKMYARLEQEMRQSYCAVTQEDYQKLVKNLPGLCIHKVKAVFDPQEHLVKVTVKPYHSEHFPKLSSQYRDMICRYLEERRMLGTRIAVNGAVYVAIDVRAVVAIKKHYQHGEQTIRELLAKELDFVSSEREFGDTLFFNEVFQKLKELPCVDYVEELILTPALPQAVVVNGLDIQMRADALCFAGKIRLELIRGLKEDRRW